MKRVVSISLGSSKRDHCVVAEFGGENFSIERIGTDGNKEKFVQLIKELDGKVDAFGMGGTDLYIYAGNKRYVFKESATIAAIAKHTPIVDGSGIKNTLERRVVHYLKEKEGITFQNKNTLIVCAVDRFGLAEELVAVGSRAVFGDLLFGLGLPVPIRSLKTLALLARMIAPVITRLPIEMFYPTGERQTRRSPRFSQYFAQAEFIAGDFHFIRRYMPEDLKGKTVITNTVTQKDEELLRQSGIKTLVTTTPEMGGRSLGTNVLEAVLVTLLAKSPALITAADYEYMLDKIDIRPRVRQFSK